MELTYTATVNVDIDKILELVFDILLSDYEDKIIDEAITEYAEAYHYKYERAVITDCASKDKIYKEIEKRLDNLIKK